MFASSREVATDKGKAYSTLDGTKGAWNFLAYFYHTNILLCLIVSKMDIQIMQESEHRGPIIMETFEPVSSFRFFWSAPFSYCKVFV